VPNTADANAAPRKSELTKRDLLLICRTSSSNYSWQL
jgi:hypothetical protein